MTRDKLIEKLRACHGDGDPEAAHVVADQLLLNYIDDPDIAVAFEAIPRWYA